MILVTVGPVSNPDWSGGLSVLKVEDVRGLLEALMRELEGRRRPLWIWNMSIGVAVDGTQSDQAGNEGTYHLQCCIPFIPFVGMLNIYHSPQG